MSYKVLRDAQTASSSDAADDSELCGSNSSRSWRRRAGRSGSGSKSQVTEIYLILFLLLFLLLLLLLLVSIKIQPSFGSVALCAGFWQQQTDGVCLRLWLHMRLYLVATPSALLHLLDAVLLLLLLFSLIRLLIFAELLSHQQPPILWIADVCCTLHASPLPCILILLIILLPILLLFLLLHALHSVCMFAAAVFCI